MRALATSPDGQWLALRQDREVTVCAAATAAPVGKLALAHDDAQLVFVGPPSVLVAIAPLGTRTEVVVFSTPALDAIARVELAGTAKLAAVSGARLALTTGDGKVTVVRIAGHALASQTLDLGGPIEFAVGLDRNQILFGLLKKLEVWDAASGHPVGRPRLDLPPAPRLLGAAGGHLWAIRPDRPELYLYRLSDGRPFRHSLGAPIERVIAHPASPTVVVATPDELVRIHCFAHTLQVIEGVDWKDAPLAQRVVGEDVTLLGWPASAEVPWSLTLAGDPATATASATATATATASAPASAPVPVPVPDPAPAPRRPPSWRDALAAYGTALARDPDLTDPPPPVPDDTPLTLLARRLDLSPAAHRALVPLYALHLVGRPALPLATLARLADDWSEPLGHGDLAALALVRREHGTIALRTAVTDLLDGAPPRTVRLVGDAASPAAPTGAFRVARDGRSDAEIETALVATLGRIAIVEGPLDRGLLEARLHAATAVAFAGAGGPGERPRPWPRGAGLVLVLYGTASSWIADLPALDTTPTVATAS